MRESVDTPHGEAAVTRLFRGVVGGLGAGLPFIWVTMWFATTMPEGKAEMPLRMISTIVKGDDAMAEGTTSVGLGWGVHLVLSAAFGIAFALLTPALRTNGTLLLAGTAYGGLLYVVNFLVLAPLAFTTFENANKPFELVVHIAFGTLLSIAFLSSGPRRREPVAAVTMERAERRPAGV